MSSGTGDRIGQVAGAQSVDGSGNPIPAVIPGDWSKLFKFKVTLAGDEPKSIMELLCDQITNFAADRMLELVYWSVSNFGARTIWVGGIDFAGQPNVAEGEDYPVPAATDPETPGFHAAKSDPRHTYLLLPGSGEQEVVIHFQGKV